MAHRKIKPMSAESKAIIDNYPSGQCPDCYWMIRRNVVEGEACRNCGHVFTSKSYGKRRKRRG